MGESVLNKAERAAALLAGSDVCGMEAVRIQELCRRLGSQEITVSVIGQFKRGKSTLVNAILGEELLPVGIVPVTSAVTRLQYGKQHAEVHFENGEVKEIDLDSLSQYIDEQKNEENILAVSYVNINTPSAFLQGGLILVDTPGVGSVHKHNSNAAYAFVKESDAVIFMLSVDSPLNEIEMDFLRNAQEYAAKFYFAVNKVDTVEAGELDIYMTYCRKLLCRLLAVEQVAMFPVSAKQGLGLDALKATIQKECKNAAEEILESSAVMKLKDALSSAISQIRLYWNVLNMPAGKFNNIFKRMEEQCSILIKQSKEAAAEFEQERDELLEMVQEIFFSAADSSGEAQMEQIIYGLRYFGYGILLMDHRLTVSLNGVKQQLALAAADMFGFEYHYDLEESSLPEISKVEVNLQGEVKKRYDLEHFEKALPQILSDCRQKAGQAAEQCSQSFVQRTEFLCEELRQTMSRILMYKEKNAYTVARRLEDLNQLVRELRQIRDSLEA